jgi:hypothetical protein
LNSILTECNELDLGKEIQRSHIFNIKFKLPIVNDGIEYKNDKKRSDGYSTEIEYVTFGGYLYDTLTNDLKINQQS